jgi:hypothetical protein
MSSEPLPGCVDGVTCLGFGGLAFGSGLDVGSVAAGLGSLAATGFVVECDGVRGLPAIGAATSTGTGTGTGAGAISGGAAGGGATGGGVATAGAAGGAGTATGDGAAGGSAAAAGGGTGFVIAAGLDGVPARSVSGANSVAGPRLATAMMITAATSAAPADPTMIGQRRGFVPTVETAPEAPVMVAGL